LDLVLTIVFSMCAVLAVAGAVASTLGPRATWRLIGLLAVAVGVAGMLASLSAGFAALVALVALGASALLVGGAAVTAEDAGGDRLPAVGSVGQLGAVAAALLLAALIVVAVGGSFASGAGTAGAFDVATLGRLLFGRDALAVVGLGASLLVALAFGSVMRSRRP
jgi:NADH:ubiquinone oxidoreductase subunit 6 (subunit J)